MIDNNKDIQLMIAIIKNAINITEWFREEGYQSYIKQDKSPVTLADYASQIYIISKLKEIYPNDSIVAEESYSSQLNLRPEKIIQNCFNALNLNVKLNFRDILNYRGPKSERQWSIDPIDGTKGYQEGLSYAIGIGLMSNYEKTLSIIGVPNYNEEGVAIFVANKNHGAQASYGGKKFVTIKVSEQKNINQSFLCHSLHYDEPWVMKLAKILGIEKFIQIDSMAKFCMIADGSAELYLKPMKMDLSYIWDFLPGDLLVNEAGGVVTDLNGKPAQYVQNKCVITAPGLISSNGNFHKEILEAIRNNSNIFN